MPNESNHRLNRIEANLERVTELIIQTAERQSVSEHQIERPFQALSIDAANIRELARITEAH